MGCCCSSNEDKTSQQGEPNERTTLLGNPVSNSSNRPAYNDDYSTQYKSAFNQKGDEQSALKRILLQTETDVIDVSAMGSHLEQREYLDRARQYSQRVNSAQQHFTDSFRKTCLLADVPAVDKVLSADPVPAGDCAVVNDLCNKALKALEDVKVEHQEDLVVQFGIP